MNEKNKTCLMAAYPDLYELYKDRISQHELVETNGFANIWINDRCLHSRYQPEVEAGRWVESLNIAENQDAISIIGLGLGYYLAPLQTKYPDKKLIIIEPDPEAFLAFLEVADATSALEDENIVFLVDKDPNTVKHLMEHYYKTGKISKVFFTQMPAYEHLHSQYIDLIYDQLRVNLKLTLANVATDLYFVNMWLFNVIQNIKNLSVDPDISCLSNRFEQKPVVIVSAGPSLEKQLPMLRDLQDKALIIAVGSAAAILDHHKIEAHIIMGLDGHPLEGNIFKSLKSSEPLFVYAHIIHHDAVAHYQGKKMWFVPTGEMRIPKMSEQLGIETPEIISGGSIAHTALAFAHWLKCDPIIMVGQDLAYTNSKLYASGATHETDGVNPSSHILEKDMYGEPIYTKAAFIHFRDWFEEYIAYLLNDIKIFNCTEGGLNIRGAQNRAFADVISEYCVERFDFKAKLAEAHHAGQLISESVFKDEIEKLKESLQDCKTLSEQRVKLLDKLLEDERYLSESYEAEFDHILELTEELEENLFYQIFLQHTGQIYQTWLSRTVQLEADKATEIGEKRRILLTGLANVYFEVDRYIAVSDEAMQLH